MLAGGFDQGLDLLGRRGAALRQRAHFRRHDREAAALFAGAASTAAFSARILVWKAMPSMTEMISWTLAELAAMSCMVAIMRRMAWPPASAVCEAASAIALPLLRAFGVLFHGGR